MTLAQLKSYVGIHFANGSASMADDALMVALNNIIELVLTAAPLEGNLAGLVSDTAADPGTPTVDMVYITITPGTYTNFLDSGAAAIVVPANAVVAFLSYSVDDEYWTLSSVTDSTLGAIVAVTNKASGGSIGTAATTVDIANVLTVNQTTAGQTLTLTSPTATTKVRNVLVLNIGTADFIMAGITITAGGGMEYVWNGSAWKYVAVNSLKAIVAVTNKASGGSIGTAATTVDITNMITVNQTTASQALTMADPTVTGTIRSLKVFNIGSASFTLGGVTISAGGAAEYVWDGVSAWKYMATNSFAALTATSLTVTSTFKGVITALTNLDYSGAGNTGTLGSAATTVDLGEEITLNQTTASQVLTLPSPTVATAGRILWITNIGSTSVTIAGKVLTATAGTQPTVRFIWTGAAWK